VDRAKTGRLLANDDLVTFDVIGGSTNFNFTVLADGRFTLVPELPGEGFADVRLTAGRQTTTVRLQLVVIDEQPSCAHVVALDAANGSGVYTFVGSTDAKFDAYCDMDHDGGGWTLVLKADGNDDEFSAESALWTDTNLLTEDSTPERRADLIVGASAGRLGESKLESFLTVKVDALRVGFARQTTGVTAFSFVTPDLVLPSTFASARALFSGGPIVLASPTYDEWVEADASFTLPGTQCRASGINIDPNRPGLIRVGIFGRSTPHAPTTSRRSALACPMT